MGGEWLLAGVAGGPLALGEHDQPSGPALTPRCWPEPAPEGEQVVDADLSAAIAPDAPAGVHG